LSAPFAGRVFVPPDAPPGNGPTVAVTVSRAEPGPPQFQSRRHELVPGADDPRRVVRLACTVGLLVQPASNAGRGQRVAGVDALVYLLDGPELRSAAALRAAGDPGFLIDELELTGIHLGVPAERAADADVELRVTGWFWPRSAPGIAGAPMRPRIRSSSFPVALSPHEPLVAGGAAVTLRLEVDTVGTFALDEDAGATVEAFGPLAVGLTGPGGRPGRGALTGGTAGPEGSRLLEIEDAAVTISYTPPNEEVADELVVRLVTDDAEAGPRLGLVLGRFPLAVVTA
jgi:hypothetical protein